MNTLIELQNHYQFDTDKQVHHQYLTEYDKWFLPRKYQTGYLLELGVARGGSLLLWQKYFEHMNIVGMDRNPLGTDVYGNFPDHTPSLPNRTFFIQKNSYETNTVTYLADAYKPFNIIIDDGSHELRDQQFVVTNYHKLIQNGLLIIEDVIRANIIALLETCYNVLRHRTFTLTMVDNNNARRVPPDRSTLQNYGNIELQYSTSDDVLVCIELFY